MNIQFPKWLYEKLPSLYVLLGILLLIKGHNTLAMYSGLLLLVAGILVWRERRRYRAHHYHIIQTIDQRYGKKSRQH